MLKWLKSLFSMPEPAGPPQTIRTFSVNDRIIAQDGVRIDADTIRIESTEGRTVRLYDVKDPSVHHCIVTYRVKMKAEKVEGRAFLEMVFLPWPRRILLKGATPADLGNVRLVPLRDPFLPKEGADA